MLFCNCKAVWLYILMGMLAWKPEFADLQVFIIKTLERACDVEILKPC